MGRLRGTAARGSFAPQGRASDHARTELLSSYRCCQRQPQWIRLPRRL